MTPEELYPPTQTRSNVAAEENSVDAVAVLSPLMLKRRAIKVCVYLHIDICVYMYVLCMYVCIYRYIYIYTYIHTYIHI